MRRPSPLPSPPAAPARPERPRPPRASSGGGDAPDRGFGDDDEITGVIVPLVTPDDTRSRPSDGDAGSAPDRDADADGSGRVSVRHVWRAARARRKALRAEVRRFTGRQRRRRAVWIGVAASLVILVLATLGAAYSPLFGVEKITVVGTSQLDATAVESALAGQLGTPLARIDDSAVKAALIAFPLVETYAIEARPPHELVVRIVERTPVGVLQTPAGYSLVDAAGVTLSTTATIPAGQPVLNVPAGVGSAAFTAVGRVVRTLPASIRPQVTAVTATTPDDVTFTLGATNTQVVWGGVDQSALKAVVLERAMVARPLGSVSVYDVSSPKAIVFR